MSSTKPTPRKQAVSNAKTVHRHRSDDEKLKIVQESFEEGWVHLEYYRARAGAELGYSIA